jgi:ubiquinone/menaquinone biosynthesis C-methylase UbiE
VPIQKDPEAMEILYLEKAVSFSCRHVLEIGCGDGRLTWRYARSALRVTGVDLDSEALHSALTSCPDTLDQTVSFINASSLALPFHEDEFNLALLSWTL